MIEGKARPVPTYSPTGLERVGVPSSASWRLAG